MKYIRHILKEVGYTINDFLRRICGGLSPDARLTVILIMLLVFTIGNLYFTISTIYNWGHRDGKNNLPEIQHMDGLGIIGSGTESDTIDPNEFIDSPIDVPHQWTDSINTNFLTNNEKGTGENRSC
jgi:hypothetical protein